MGKELNNEQPEKKEVKLFAQISKAADKVATKTKEVAEKAQETVVNVIDKNGNGQIDKEDFGLDDETLKENKEKTIQFLSETGEKVKNTGKIVGQAIVDVKEEMDRKSLRPVYRDDLVEEGENTLISKLSGKQNIIRIVPKDKKREEKYQDSIGYHETIKGMELLSIYEENAKELGLSFSPNVSQTLYYIDPYRENFYVALDEYFTHFKQERVNELEVVAQKLGAKHFTVKFREKQKSITKKKINVSANAKMGLNSAEVTANKESIDDRDYNLEIAADIRFTGYHEPIRPELVYFKNESDIEKLVEMRMDQATNQIQSKKFVFQCGRNVGIKEQEAIKIDGVLQYLKCSGNTTISDEVRRETRTELEYYIEF